MTLLVTLKDSVNITGLIEYAGEILDSIGTDLLPEIMVIVVILVVLDAIMNGGKTISGFLGSVLKIKR